MKPYESKYRALKDEVKAMQINDVLQWRVDIVRSAITQTRNAADDAGFVVKCWSYKGSIYIVRME